MTLALQKTHFEAKFAGQNELSSNKVEILAFTV